MRVHIMSYCDATDPAMDRLAMGTIKSWEKLKSKANDDVAIDVGIDRVDAKPPRFQSLRKLLRIKSEPVWSGHRVYDNIVPHRTRLIDTSLTTEAPWSGDREASHLVDFFRTRMSRYPQALKIVHVQGHGDGYRYSAGLPAPQYNEALRAASTADLLVVESCVQSSLESLAAIYPCAHYALVSQDGVTRPAVDEIVTKAILATQGGPATALDLGQRMVAAAGRTYSNEITCEERALIPNLSLIKMDQVPQLVAAVDRMGTLLADEVSGGRAAPALQAIARTRRYPVSDQEYRDKLDIGDLRYFATWAKYYYTKSGDNVPPEVSAQAAASPQRAAVAEACGAVLQALEQTVVAKQMDQSHQDSGGINIQLPGTGYHQYEAEKPTRFHFEDSAAPAGWKRFVREVEATAKKP